MGPPRLYVDPKHMDPKHNWVHVISVLVFSDPNHMDPKHRGPIPSTQTVGPNLKNHFGSIKHTKNFEKPTKQIGSTFWVQTYHKLGPQLGPSHIWVKIGSHNWVHQTTNWVHHVIPRKFSSEATGWTQFAVAWDRFGSILRIVLYTGLTTFGRLLNDV